MPGKATSKKTVQTMAAELYIAKRDSAAREIAAQAGVPYGSESISDEDAYRRFYLRDTDVDEQRTWAEAAAAVAAGKLPADRLVSYVVEKVYPNRIAVTQGGGRTDLKAQTAFVERMNARRRRDQDRGSADVAPSMTEPAPATPAPEPSPEGSY